MDGRAQASLASVGPREWEREWLGAGAQALIG